MRAGRVVIGVLACCIPLAGCSQSDALGAQPVTPAFEITKLNEAAVRLPPGFTSTSVIQFDSQPLVAGDLAVGLRLPTSARPDLNIHGVGADGTRLQLRTNPSCVGFVPTRDEKGPLLVVLDSDAAVDHGRLATTTVATAFRLDDGSVAWGPVPVPGPVVSGSGLIFAATPKSVVSSAAGPRVMPSAADGPVVSDRSDSSISFLHEHHGLGLISAGATLRAIDTASNSIRWAEEDLTRPEGAAPGSLAEFTSMIGANQGSIIFLSWETLDGEAIIAAYDFATGQYLGSLPPGTPDASTTAPDSSASAVLTVREGVAVVTALSPEAGVLWQAEMVGEVRLGAATNAAVYVALDGEGVALSWEDGTEAARGDFPVPSIVDSAGTAYVPTGVPFQYAIAVP